MAKTLSAGSSRKFYIHRPATGKNDLPSHIGSAL
ncbi:conserved hypothetical protein, partial [delta proteobacterium NaphS2]